MNYKILTDFLDKLDSHKKYNNIKMIEAIKLNEVRNENCLDTMKLMKDNFLDLTITSPPYDNLRTYNGYSFDFESIAKVAQVLNKHYFLKRLVLICTTQ